MDAERRERCRDSVTNTVSKIGINRNSTGAASAATGPEGRPLIGTDDRTAREPPRKRLPLSPMKIDAGWKLNSRKPTHAPASAMLKTKSQALGSLALRHNPIAATA